MHYIHCWPLWPLLQPRIIIILPQHYQGAIIDTQPSVYDCISSETCHFFMLNKFRLVLNIFVLPNFQVSSVAPVTYALVEAHYQARPTYSASSNPPLPKQNDMRVSYTYGKMPKLSVLCITHCILRHYRPQILIKIVF